MKTANKRHKYMKALSIALKTTIYSYRMAINDNTFENITGREDSLTGLPNRRGFNEFAENHEVACIALIDCDNFKQINDTFGHQRGDEVLQVIGRILKEQDAFAARLGGDEFVIAFEKYADAAGTISDVRDKAAKWAGVTLSVGVSGNGSSVRDKMKSADRAMYLSKNSGKNSVTYNGDMVSQVSGRKIYPTHHMYHDAS